MSSLFDIINTVNVALKDDEGFDWSELDKAMVDLHLKLTEPKWAIEDEALREECEKLLIRYAVQRYLVSPLSSEEAEGLSDEPPTSQ